MHRVASAAEFDGLLQHQAMVVVKFYTDWCPDCHRTAPAYADYAGEHGQRAAFAEVNAEQVREIAERYDVRGYPSLLVFAGGELVQRLYSRDAKTAAQVTAFLDAVLAVPGRTPFPASAGRSPG